MVPLSKEDKISCARQIQELQTRLKTFHDAAALDSDLVSRVAADQGGALAPVDIKLKRTLRGHFGKVYSLAWSSDSKCLCTAAQDGKVIIWNCLLAAKLYSISLRSTWVMSCSMSPTNRLVASGGLDNIVTIHRLPEQINSELKTEWKDAAATRVHAELVSHEGYISSCSFIGDNKIFTTSGDSSCSLFDIEAQQREAVFNGHTQDVMGASITSNGQTAITCSVDYTSRLWDLRQNSSRGKAMMTFRGHEADVNTVKFLRNDTTFISGSEDSTCRLYDIRSGSQLNVYQSPDILSNVQSLDISASGRFLFVAYDIPDLWVWDTLFGKSIQILKNAHESRLSTLFVSPNGSSVATGSWDNNVKIWA